MSMQQYTLDSESDEEEVDEIDIHNDLVDVDVTEKHYMAELESIKFKASELISKDNMFKKERNRVFICKLLNLEEPVITAKMVDFLMQEGVCECLLECITKVGHGERPKKESGKNEVLRIAYR